MIKYNHKLRFIEGSLESGNFEDVATLKYEGTLPAAPANGLVISINDSVEFKMSCLKYIPKDNIYESFSYIDFLELENRLNDYVPRADYIAAYVKSGFTIVNTTKITKDEIELAAKDVVI